MCEKKGRLQRRKLLLSKLLPPLDEEDSSKNKDEDFAMIARRVAKIFYKKGRQSNF